MYIQLELFIYCKKCNQEIPYFLTCPHLERKKLMRLKKENLKLFIQIQKKKRRIINNNYRKKRSQEDASYRAINNIRHRLKKFLKTKNIRITKSKSIGCSSVFLKKYLESRFAPNMNWDNYGKLWHIDHIRPLISFNMSNPEEKKMANHYTNLRPMLAKDNLKKGKKYDAKSIQTLQ